MSAAPKPPLTDSAPPFAEYRAPGTPSDRSLHVPERWHLPARNTERRPDTRDTHNIIWGVFLITIGILLLLERLGGLRIPTGSLWPLVLFALAVSSAVRGRIVSTIMFTMLGTIFLGVTLNWFGLSYAHSWPLLMVIAGVAMVIRALIGAPRIARRSEVPHE